MRAGDHQVLSAAGTVTQASTRAVGHSAARQSSTSTAMYMPSEVRSVMARPLTSVTVPTIGLRQVGADARTVLPSRHQLGTTAVVRAVRCTRVSVDSGGRWTGSVPYASRCGYR